MKEILIVDDNADAREQLKWGLAREYSVHFAKDGIDGFSIFEKRRTQVVILDLGLPPHENGAEEGFRCLEKILKVSPSAKVIVVTGQNERENSLKAVQMGAYDFIQKPLQLNELKIIVSRAIYLSDIEQENRQLQSAFVDKANGLCGMIGLSLQMEQVFSTIRKISSSDIPALIIGESGTGKELVARAIHSISLRKSATFVPINCGAIPENLLESELFGVEKGAFTGASAQIAGKVEFAHQGTLFLDEIAEMPISLQVKMLRFLQDKIIQRIGGRKDIVVDARIIAATNVDIKRAIGDGKFREDLYYRLGVISINLPPLRERGDDIAILANLFLKRFSENTTKKITCFSNTALEFMNSYQWPGNVRELENRIQRAVIMSESSVIGLHDLGFNDIIEGKTKTGLTLKETRDMVEKDMLLSTIKQFKGNMTRVSRALGVSRTTLYDLMKRHSIDFDKNADFTAQNMP